MRIIERDQDSTPSSAVAQGKGQPFRRGLATSHDGGRSFVHVGFAGPGDRLGDLSKTHRGESGASGQRQSGGLIVFLA